MKTKRSSWITEFIGGNITLIYELMIHYDIQKQKGILVLVDFKKAYDKLDWKFIPKGFEHSNFGDKILKWTKILQKDSKSIISQNGFFSDSISLEGAGGGGVWGHLPHFIPLWSA